MATTTEQSRHVLRIEGMHCAGCVGSVERALQAVDGVVGARVSLVTNQAQVVANDTTEMTKLVAAIEGVGFTAALEEMHDGRHLLQTYDRQRRIWLTRFIASLSILIVMLLNHFSPSVWVQAAAAQVLQVLLAGTLLFVVGWPIVFGGVRQLLRLQPDMDSLIAIGTSAAFLAGLVGWLTGTATMTLLDVGMILSFIILGRLLESTTRRGATKALADLMEMAPQEVTVIVDGNRQQIPAVLVEAGTTVQYQAGDRFALDGVVLSGQGDVDESWLTGESLPVAKSAGDTIYAGTQNGSAVLETRVTQPRGTTMLDRVIELVNEAQASKSQMQSLADRVVRWFVPGVIAIALTTVFVWVVAGSIQQGIESAVAVLIVACPCALGLATPVAILVASSRAARRGILIKNAAALERTAQLQTVVFDKTGTLTTGRLRVVDIATIRSNWAAESVLGLAAAVEQASRHPVAESIVNEAQQRQLELPQLANVREHAGSGMTATLNGRDIIVGSARLLAHYDVPIETELSDQTSVFVASDGHHVGTITLRDELADSGREVVAELQRRGIQVVILSGDRQAVADRVASELQIRHVEAELLPQQKHTRIGELAASGTVAMVGDGINDAPALSAADLGIALGAGADIAIESADVVLVRNDLRDVVRTIDLGRRTVTTIKQNLAWAFSYNVLLIPVAAGALVPLIGLAMHPVFAASAMAISSVSVVMNSLRIR